MTSQKESLWVAIVTLSLLMAGGVNCQISFRESALSKGIDHQLSAQTAGAGVSFYDFDQDGWDDLTLGTSFGEEIGFFKNENGSYRKISPLVQNIDQVKQILWVDFDNDGDSDLYVAAFEGINRLYQNNGPSGFRDITAPSNLPLEFHRGFGAAFGDINRDGWLDLYYVSRDIPGDLDFLNVSRLFVNNADGTFSEISEASGTLDPGKTPFCSSFLDYNNDMWPDIYTAQDRSKGNTLFQNNGDLTFDDVSDQSKAGVAIEAMCVNFADVNRNGVSEIYVTNISDGNVFLMRPASSEEPITYMDIAAPTGTKFFGTGWGSNFFDADNDGDLDLYVSGSDVGSDRVSSLFYEHDGHLSFDSQSVQGMEKDTVISYANAIGDTNNDGLIDIVVQNNPPYKFHLWNNTSLDFFNFVKINLEGVLSNRDAIGCKVECYANGLYQSAYTHCGHGFLGQNSKIIHFGLSDAETVDSLKITWPTGHIDIFFQLEIDKVHELKEGQSTDGIISVDDDVTIVPRLSTSADDLADHTPITLYPSPAQYHISLQFDSKLENIEIINLQGDVSISLESYNGPIEVSHLPGGLYIVRAISKNRRLISKFVKL